MTIPPARYRYVALSYVWGVAKVFTALRGNIRELKVPGSLNKPRYYNEIPLTIRDAIRVVRDIGIRYLWVNSLYIIKDANLQEKIKHIKLIDAIYSTANLVIVTAGSDCTSAGIAGLRPGSRGFRQPIKEIAPGFRLATETQ